MICTETILDPLWTVSTARDKEIVSRQGAVKWHVKKDNLLGSSQYKPIILYLQHWPGNRKLWSIFILILTLSHNEREQPTDTILELFS